jgi:hypothetical protein
MIDAIDRAVAASRSAGDDKTQQVSSAGAAAVESLQSQADALVDSLPTVPDPALIYRQKEAEVLKKLAALDQQQIELQEIALNDATEQIRNLTIPTLPIPLKIPLLSPKILSAVAVAKREKLLAKLRQEKSKINLKKGKELFTYPLKPPKSLQLPSTPTLPSLPSVPTVPKIPTVDSLPKL